MKKYFVYIQPKELLAEKGGFREVDGESVIIRGFEELDLFLHQPYGIGREFKSIWMVSEGKTGAAITGWAISHEQAKQFALEKLEGAGLDRVREVLAKHLKKKAHRSPRYAVGQI